MPWRPVILLTALLAVVAIPLSTGDWVTDGPWFRLFGAAAATIVFLYWFYTRESAEPPGARRGQIVLFGCPTAAVLGALMAGASLAVVWAALIVGIAFGVAFFVATP